DVPAAGVGVRRAAVRVGRRSEATVEYRRVVEAEERVGAAVVEEPEAAHLYRLRRGRRTEGGSRDAAVVPRGDGVDRRHPEHADLLVQIPKVRDLQMLGLVLEAREPVGPEVAVRRVQRVTTVAGLDGVGRDGVEERLPCLLCRGEAVVEFPIRVRWE